MGQAYPFYLLAGVCNGILVGFVALLGIRVYYFIRKIPPAQRRLRWPHLTLLFLALLSVTAYGTVRSLVADDEAERRQEGNFYEYEGYQDFRRIPLVYPYELISTGWMHSGALRNHETGGTIANAGAIIRYTLSGDYLLAEAQADIANVPDDINLAAASRWLVFDCANSSLKVFEDHNSFIVALKDYGITTLPEMRTCEAQWENYWRNSNER